MVFLAGPRQSGKTTLALHCAGLASPGSTDRYMNWDATPHRQAVIQERFPEDPGPLILDEIHKYSRRRQVLKGLCDVRKGEPRILVTGSARLDHYRRGGDSLQGRYHFFTLFPFTLEEVGGNPREGLDSLFHLSGFPEPFLSGSETEARRWGREYRARIVEEDPADLERVLDVALVERPALRLPELVGAPLSINGLREDLQVSHPTVSRWVRLLENVYMIFRVYPFGAQDIRAVKKEAKHYHLDWTRVPDPAARFENLVACHLLGWTCFAQAVNGYDRELKYFRDTDKREVDFIVCEPSRPLPAVECKLRNRKPAVALRYFKRKFPDVQAVQVVMQFDGDERTRDGVRVCGAQRFLRRRIV